MHNLKIKLYQPLLNYLVGLSLSLLNPFKEGDYIEIDGRIGTVKNRGLRRTAIESSTGDVFTVENRKFYFKTVHNLSTQHIIPIDLKLTVDLDSDISEVKSDIFDFLSNHELILDSPLPKIQVTKIHANQIDLVVRPWCRLDHYLELDAELNELLIAQVNGLVMKPSQHIHTFLPERKLLIS